MRPGQVEHRVLRLDLNRADPRERTVPASLSSELPVERFWGVEVLEHSVEAVDLTRAIDGKLPLIASHDPEQLPRPGNVERVRVGDRRLRGVLRLADTTRGRELWDAMQQGFLEGVSIGYRILEAREDGRDERTGLPIYRVTRWQPYEVSLVNLPADTSVGIGRSLPAPQKEHEIMNEKFTPPRIEAGDHDETQAERERVSEILRAGRQWKLDELAERHVQAGSDLATWRKAALAELGKRNVQINPERPLPDGGGLGGEAYGIPQRELERYSVRRAILSLIPGGNERDFGLERAVSAQLGRATGRESEGILLPMAALLPLQRDIAKTAPGTGSYLIATDHLGAQYIDLLRSTSIVLQAGARLLTGLVGDVAIPKRSTAATAYWIAEGDALTESTPVFTRLSLSPKTVGGWVEFTRKMLLQSSPGIELLCRQDLAAVLATAIDSVALNGGGTGEPDGILATIGIGDVEVGNTFAEWSHICELIADVASSNALAGALAFATNGLVMSQLLQAKVDAGSGVMIWQEAPAGSPAQGKIAGYPAFMSTNVPSNLGAGLNRSALIFGDFSQVLIGQWGVLEILVDPYTGFTTGNVRIRALQDLDVGVRQAGAFSASQDIDHSAAVVQ